MNKHKYQIELVTAKNSSPSLVVSAADGAAKALHSLYDPEAEAAAIVSGFEFNGKGVLVILGLGLGYHIKALISKYPDAEFIIVEPDQKIFEFAKEHSPLKENFNSLNIIAGKKSDEVLSTISKLQIKSGMKQVSYFRFAPEVSIFAHYFEPIIKALNISISVKLWEKLRYKKFSDTRVRILLIDQRYFLTREVERAAEANGHIVEKVSLSKGEVTGDMLPRLLKKIVEYKPDFIMTLNHLGFDEDGIIASFLESIDMPVASWYVDSPDLIVKSFNKNALPNIHLFIWDKHYIKSMKEIGFEFVDYLPLAVDEDIFKPIKLSRNDLKKYGAEISFVGNSMVRPYRESIDKIPQSIHKIVEDIASDLCHARALLDDLLHEHREALTKLDQSGKIAFNAAVLWKATMLYRTGLVNSLSSFNPVVYGDAGWKSLLSRSIQLKGQVHYYTELPLLYNASKINFNATSLQMPGAVNQRVFDVPACRAFLLTDAQESVAELFEPGHEVITYSSKEEAVDLAKYYLENDNIRMTVAERAYARVLNEHTYKHRMLYVVKRIKAVYS